MEKDIPLKIEVLSTEDDQHRINSAKEIQFLLNHISNKGSRVALYFSQGSDFILTTMLHVDEEGLWLEQSPNPAENKQILASRHQVMVTSHTQVKVQFTANGLSSVDYDGYPAFYMPLPECIYRLQRREYFRLSTPVANPLHCIIHNGPNPNMQQDVVVMDISGGGIGLTCAETDTELEPGHIYMDCQIELPGAGVIQCAIEVRNVFSTTTANGTVLKRAGCKFHNLAPQPMMLLQRYITNMQLEQRKRQV